MQARRAKSRSGATGSRRLPLRDADRASNLATLGIALLLLSAGSAYAVHAAAHARHHQRRVKVVPPPSITARPPAQTKETSATYRFKDTMRRVKFQCSLDGSPFKRCKSPLSYGQRKVKVKCAKHGKRHGRKVHGRRTSAGLARAVRRGRHAKPMHCGAFKLVGTPLSSGRHTFAVRVRSKRGKLSKPAFYAWTIGESPSPALTTTTTAAGGSPDAGASGAGAGNSSDSSGGGSEPCSPPSGAPSGEGQPFSIGGSPSGLLSPGIEVAIPLILHNPNGEAICVTSLSVEASGGPPGCEAATDIAVRQSNASLAHAVLVPAGGSVQLPAQGVSEPAVQLLELPTVNQEACKGASFPLRYTGSAHS